MTAAVLVFLLSSVSYLAGWLGCNAHKKHEAYKSRRF